MKYDFDTVIERHNTDSTKWDGAKRIKGNPRLLPLWVADMDFPAPAPVIDALRTRVEHGIFGYTMTPDSCYEAIITWMQKRHGWRIQKEWIVLTPGVVSAVYWSIMTAARPGDHVIIQPPVYFPFATAAKQTGCQVRENQLCYADGRYEIDFDQLETCFDTRSKMLVLCSPHNPVGRVWTAEELHRLADACLRHNVLLCSDEIHSDLILGECKHVPTAMLSDEIAQSTITCMAANKTFNIAGLKSAVAIIPNSRLREEFLTVKQRVGVGSINLFGQIATEAAYAHGEEWLEQLLQYIRENLDFLLEYVSTNIPDIVPIPPEGTYLVWLDCRTLGLDDTALSEFFLNDAEVWLNDGFTFGPGGSGFMRLNLACPRSILEEALHRIARAVKQR